MSQSGVARFNSGGGGSSGIQTITGNDGVPESPTVGGNFNLLTANATVQFTGSLNTETLDFGLTNLLLGSSGMAITSATLNVGVGSGALASITTSSGSGNVGVGNLALNAVTLGNGNTGIGFDSLAALTSGSSNTVVGSSAGNHITSSNNNTAVGADALNGFTTGAAGAGSNTAIGDNSLLFLSTGTLNTALGTNSGNAYTGSESSNIVIGNTGTLAESNVIRLGTQGSGSGQQNKCFIAGIIGVSASNAQLVTINSSTGQLGVQASTVVTAWTDEGVSFNAAAGNGYFSTAAITATLPAAPAQGTKISFIVDSASALTIQANTGQILRLGATTSAAAGTAASTARGNSITLVYRVSDTTWIALSSIGTWTLT